MAYIDSELAKRRHGHAQPYPSSDPGRHHEGSTPAGLTKDGLPQRQPAALGKLHEIDLGPDATLRNIARTEAAQRRLEAGEEGPEREERAPKVRLRKDGRPWRGRRRRNSEDVKRDRLVEEVLRESRRMLRPPDPSRTTLIINMQQWRSTTSRTPTRLPTTTRRPTTASPSSFAASSSMPSLRAVNGLPRRLLVSRRRVSRRRRGGRSWGAVGVRGRRCGSCRRRRGRSRAGMQVVWEGRARWVSDGYLVTHG